MRRSPNRRRARRIAGTAAIAVIAVTVVAGCSSTTKGSQSSGTPLPGITANSVKVGFTIVDVGKLAKSLGFVDPDYGGISGESKAINAVVDYINKNGGAGGRQMTADIKVYDAPNDSPELSQAECNGYTQDDKVFAVVMDGMFQTNAMPCYKAANTIVADETLIAHDQTQFAQNSPYLWSPTHPEYGNYVKAQLASMKQQGFFNGNTGVLLAPADDEVSRRVNSTIVLPYLQSIGITKTQTSYVDSTSTGTIGLTSDAALTAGKNGNLNRVIVVGGARILPIMISSNKAVGYTSQWGISTYDDPIFELQNPATIVTELRDGMKGIGYMPAEDVGNGIGPAFPDPSNPAQVKCVQIISAAGATPPNNLRANWKNALEYCDGALFLKSVLDQVPGAASVTGPQFKDAVAKIGSNYHSSVTFGSQWGGSDVYAGTNTAQALFWNSATNQFNYGGQNITFGPAASASTSTGAGTATTAPSTGATSGSTGGTGSVPLETITVPPGQ